MFIEIVFVLFFLSLAVFAVPLRYKWGVMFAVLGAGALAGSAEALSVLLGEGTLFYTGGADLVFGNRYGAVDKLSAFFIAIVSIAGCAVGVYSKGYLAPYYKTKSPIQLSLHYFCLLAMFFSMLLVVTFRDGFAFLFAWELMTLASFLLVLFDAERREVRRAALNYLILMHIGFIFLVVGFATLYAAGLPVTFDALGLYFSGNKAIPLFAVFLIGFGMKAGMFPLHVWLPEAHPAAPSHVSAFMSGVMIKMGVYGVIRVASHIDTQLYAAGLIVLVAGIVTGLWGVILAVLQNDMKKILAYSSIENIGIVLIGLGIGMLGRSQGSSLLALCGMAGALLHTMNHSFFKTLLFLGAGNVYSRTHTTALDALGGVGRRMPVTSVLFLAGTLAICALPPLNGFVSEFMIYFGLFDGVMSEGMLTVVSIFALTALSLIGGLVVMAFTKLYGIVFLGSARSGKVADVHEVPASMIVGMAFPLSGILIVGLTPFWSARWAFGIAGELFGVGQVSLLYEAVAENFVHFAYALGVFVLLVLLLWFVRRAVMRRRSEAESPTWVCGFTAATSRMQYTGESFSEGFQRLSRSMTNNSGSGERIGADEIFPVSHNFEVRHKDKIDSLFEAWWVEFIRRVNARFSRLRTGKVNHYILYALLFLVLVFFLSVFNLI